jgi:hypothetical protein
MKCLNQEIDQMVTTLSGSQNTQNWTMPMMTSIPGVAAPNDSTVITAEP